MSTKTKCSIHYLSSLLLSLIFSASCSLHAAIMVTSSADSGAGTLRQALSSVNPAGDEIIFVGPLNITLTSGSLPVIDMSTAGSSLILDGGSSAITIDGSSSAQVFFVQQGDITFQNFTSLSIQNAAASGGMGGQGGGFTSPSPLLGAGGGGALGAGAAIFVNNTATVTMDSTVTQLTLDTNQAAGGTGGIGGGYPGGGSNFQLLGPGGGGGGGMKAAGSSGGNPSGDGSTSNSASTVGGGGGGGGGGGNSIGSGGGNGIAGSPNHGGAGGHGGGPSGGTGATAPSCSGNCQAAGSPGGSAPAAPAAFSGGGGGSGIAGTTATGGAGGNGNEFAGGGGGGGSSVVSPTSSNGGTGGFGGGGGGAGGSGNGGAVGGNGGFGAGGGGGGGNGPGTSTFGGGTAGNANGGGGGGGGAGLGGAIFVREGGSIILGNLLLSGNSTIAGAGGNSGGGHPGSAGIHGGDDFFLSSGCTLTFNNTMPVNISSTISSNNKVGGAGSVDGGGILKTNSGTLTLSGINNRATANASTPIGYTGTTTINGGVLAISNDNNLGIIAGSGPTISGNVVIGSAAWQFLNSVTSSRLVTLNAASEIDSLANHVILNGVIDGTGSLTKTGSGSLRLNGTNTYQDGTAIVDGSLIIGADSNIGDANGPLLIGGSSTTGAVLQANASFTLGSSRIVTLGVNGASIFNTIDPNGNILQVDSQITGTGDLTVIDSAASDGTLILTNTANDFTASLTIDGAIVQMGASPVLNPALAVSVLAGTFDLNDFDQTIGDFSGAAAGSTTLAAATLTTDQVSGGPLTYAGTISGTGGSFVKNGAGTLIFSGVNTYDGGTTINDGTLSLQGSGSLSPIGTVDVASTLPSATFDISSGGSVQIIGDLLGGSDSFVDLGANALRFGNSNGSVTFQGVIQDGGMGGSIVKKKFGTEILTNTNTYTGDTTIFAGTLSLVGMDCISSSDLVSINQGATLDISSSSTPSQTIKNLTGTPNSMIALGNNNLTFGTAVPVSVFAGSINDTGTGSITKQGSGNAVLTGQSSYQGGTTLADGTLTIFRNSSIGASGTNLYVTNSATLVLENFQTMDHPIEINAGDILTISTAFNPTISSIISETGGSAQINKTGAGTLILNNVNTYTGLTTVTQGALQFNGGSIAGNADVLASAILSGSGSIAGDVQIYDGATIRPGVGIGTLSIGGALTLNPASTTYIEITPSTNSLIAVTSTAALDGALTIFADPGTYIENTSYTLLTAASASGMFDSVNLLGQPLGTTSIIYHATFVELLLGAIPPPPSGGCQINTGFLRDNPNGINIANYLNQFANDPVIGPPLCQLSLLPTNALNAALDSISPARLAISSFVGQNTMFLIASTVSSHMAEQRLHLRYLQNKEKAETSFGPQLTSLQSPRVDLLTASNSPLSGRSVDSVDLFRNLRSFRANFDETSELHAEDTPPNPSPYGKSQLLLKKTDHYALWAEGLGEFIHQHEESHNPSYVASTGGGLIGFDYYGNHQLLLGMAVAYANSGIHQGWNAGKDKIDYYAGTFYATAVLGQGYLELGLAGSLNRFHSERRVRFSSFDAQATSLHWGGQIVPHIAGGYDFNFSWGTVEPFAAMDYDVLFQEAFSEHGATPFNMHLKGAWSAILRSEIGLHIYEVWNTKAGDFVLRETLSYINQEPIHVGNIQANLVGYPSGFSVNSFSQNQSLISPALQLFYRAHNGAFVSISYMGEFQPNNGQFLSNSILGKIGAYF